MKLRGSLSVLHGGAWLWSSSKSRVMIGVVTAISRGQQSAEYRSQCSERGEWLL